MFLSTAIPVHIIEPTECTVTSAERILPRPPYPEEAALQVLSIMCAFVMGPSFFEVFALL